MCILHRQNASNEASLDAELLENSWLKSGNRELKKNFEKRWMLEQK